MSNLILFHEISIGFLLGVCMRKWLSFAGCAKAFTEVEYTARTWEQRKRNYDTK